MRSTVFTLVAFLWAAPAFADDPAGGAATDEELARLVELEAKVVQHKKDKDSAALTADLGEMAALHKATTDPKRRERVNALFGTILAGARDETLERATLKTIGELGDASNWKHVSEYLRQPDPNKAPPLLRDGIEAAGKIKAEGAVNPLLVIVAKSRVYSAAAQAIQALGNFGDNKRVRVRILGALIGEVRKSRPGSSSGLNKGGTSNADPDEYGETSGRAGEQNRWDSLSPALVEAANQLTGKTVASADDWFEVYDRAKGREVFLFEKR
jgi:hypothetical protein